MLIILILTLIIIFLKHLVFHLVNVVFQLETLDFDQKNRLLGFPHIEFLILGTSSEIPGILI